MVMPHDSQEARMTPKWNVSDTTGLGEPRLNLTAPLGVDLVGVIVAASPPETEMGWQVVLAHAGQMGEPVAAGTAPDVDAAKQEVERAAERYRQQRRLSRGRKPIHAAAMSSTDRNRTRMARLSAREVEAETQARLLARLHARLVASNEVAFARSVAEILRCAALKAAAEYTRRNGWAFSINGPDSLTEEARALRERSIGGAAEKLETLSDSNAGGMATYSEFESIMLELRRLGFFIDTSIVSGIAQACFLGAQDD
jgi:hypothetical protein